MLRVRPHTSIFQQIILPHLSSTVPVKAQRATTTTIAVPESARHGPGPQTLRHSRRSFTTSGSRSRPPDATGDVSYDRSSAWEPYTPAPSSSRLGTREYLGLGEAERGRTRDEKDSERDKETYRKTTALALERIIKSHERPPTATATRDKGKQVDRDGFRPSPTTSTSTSTTVANPRDPLVEEHLALPRTASRKSSPTDDLDPDQDPRPPTDEHPFPPLIHRLLLGRQFRLTTLHILNSSSYALDSSLVERVAGYMERHHGKNAARRLRKGRLPSAEDRSLMTQGGLDADDPSPISLGSIPPTSPSARDMTDQFPELNLARQERLTGFYNTHLAHQLTSSSLPKGLVPPKSLPRPNTSLRQLRSLLAKIHKLESVRGFVPDRVTANLVLGCWVRCALAPNPDGVRMVLARGGGTRGKEWKISPRHTSTINRQFGGEELGKLFQLVSRLFDRAAGIPPVDVDVVNSNSDTVRTTTSSRKKKPRMIDTDVEYVPGVGVDPGLDYGRHIKPFVKIFQHGYKQQKNLAGLDALRAWDKRIRGVLSERAGKGGSPITPEAEEEVD